MCLLFYLLTLLNIEKKTALAFILIFSIHPLTTHIVSWIPGRNDSLLAIFIFTSFIYFIKYIKTYELKYLLWHLLFFTLALWTKETTVVTPFIFASFLLFFRKFKTIKTNYPPYLKLVAVWLLGFIFYFATRYSVLGTFGSNGNSEIFKSIYQNFPSITPAIGKIFLPLELSVFPTMADMSMLYGAIALSSLLIGFLISKNRNYKMILFGLIWFFAFIILTLVKTTHLVHNFTENRIYLPMFGFIFVLIGIGRPRFFEKLFIKKNGCLLILIITIFAVMTINRNKIYQDKIHFWESAVKTAPTGVNNHNNLGSMYSSDGRYDDAIREFMIVFEMDKNDKWVHNNLGVIYQRQNKFKEAEEEYQKQLALEDDSYDYAAFYNLGLLHFNTGNLDKAEEYWKKVINISPSHTDAYYDLAVLYYNKRDMENARRYAYKSYTSNPYRTLPPELLELIHR